MSRRYVISFGGLNAGKHEYEYQLDSKFFESVTISEIKKGNVRADVRLNKQDHLLIFEFLIRGTVEVPCDHCGDDCTIAVKGEYSMAAKLGGDGSVEEDIVVLPATEGDIDMAQYLYEYTVLSMPARRVHETEKLCNAESIKKLKQIDITTKETEMDPRWEALKKIKFNN